MSNQLSVTINNVELPIKEYQGQKVVTLKEIDAVHNRPEGTAKRNFNTNYEHFIEKTDFFDISYAEFSTNFVPNLKGGNPNNRVILLTESGYLMLVKSFTDDLAWDVQRQLVNTYFQATPEQRQKAAKQTKSAEELAAASKRAQARLINATQRTANLLTSIWDKAGIKPEYQVLALNDVCANIGIRLPRNALQNVKQTYDKTTIAKMVGIYSKASGGKEPHAQAVGAIISQLNISEDEREALPYSRNGHDGVDYQYTDSVVEKVRSWLYKREYPVTLTLNGKKYHVVYDEVA